MKARPNITQLAKEIFEVNKAKGYHNENRSNEHFLMLVITELSEAVEADRCNRFARIDKFNIDTSYNNYLATMKCYGYETEEKANKYLPYNVWRRENNNRCYYKYIKGSIEEELADSVIRLLDLVGLRGYKDLKDLLLVATVSEKKTFPENIFSICKDMIYYKYSEPERISYALLNIERLCSMLNIDLWLHVDLKLEYNKVQPKNKSY